MHKLYTFLYSPWYESILISCLRLSVAIIFIWFGALKIFGYNPVFDLVSNSLVPWFASSPGLSVLGLAEVIIGVLLLSNRFLLFTHALLILHLAGTFTTFIFGWHIVFNPYFPVLTLPGEFVIKNITLVISALVVLVHEKRKAAGLEPYNFT